jgi:hypothetical protein
VAHPQFLQSMPVEITVSVKRNARCNSQYFEILYFVTLHQDCKKAVALLFRMLQRGARTRDIMTREAFENATTIMHAPNHDAAAKQGDFVLRYAMGGSTNGFLHILALAHEADVAFTIDDMQRVGARVPIISNMSPHGKYHMCDTAPFLKFCNAGSVTTRARLCAGAMSMPSGACQWCSRSFCLRACCTETL